MTPCLHFISLLERFLQAAEVKPFRWLHLTCEQEKDEDAGLKSILLILGGLKAAVLFNRRGVKISYSLGMIDKRLNYMPPFAMF